MSLNQRAGKRVHLAGDSITVGQTMGNIGLMDAPGGLKAQMIAATPPFLSPIAMGRTAGVTVSETKAGGSALTYSTSIYNTAPLYTSFGQGGAAIATMRAGFATFITAFAPIETLLIEISINDFLTSTDPTQFATDYAFVLDQVRSLWPAAQVLCCGGMSSSELWLTGPPRLSSGTSTSVYDAAISTLCAARPGWTEYCSMADGMLAYEMINNAPSPGVSSGILTNDGIHPNLAGQVWMTQRYVTHFTFSP